MQSDRPLQCSGRWGTTVPSAGSQGWVLSPVGVGKLAFGLVPGGDQAESLPRTVAELPFLDLKALETGQAVLCSLPGHLPPGGWLTPSQQGEGLEDWTEPGMESTEWAFWKVLGPNSSFVKGTKHPGLGHSSRARLAASSVTNYPGPPGSEGGPWNFQF